MGRSVSRPILCEHGQGSKYRATVRDRAASCGLPSTPASVVVMPAWWWVLWMAAFCVPLRAGAAARAHQFVSAARSVQPSRDGRRRVRRFGRWAVRALAWAALLVSGVGLLVAGGLWWLLAIAGVGS
jgi:hypothetical protein